MTCKHPTHQVSQQLDRLRREQEARDIVNILFVMAEPEDPEVLPLPLYVSNCQ